MESYVSRIHKCFLLQNLTYVMNPNYPSAFTDTSQECKYTVNAVRDSKIEEIIY